jgi:hypothetical protein
LKPEGFPDRRRPSAAQLAPYGGEPPYYYGDSPGVSASPSRRTSGAAPTLPPSIHVDNKAVSLPPRGRPRHVAQAPRSKELDVKLGTVVAETNAFFERMSTSAGFTVAELHTRVSDRLVRV